MPLDSIGRKPGTKVSKRVKPGDVGQHGRFWEMEAAPCPSCGQSAWSAVYAEDGSRQCAGCAYPISAKYRENERLGIRGSHGMTAWAYDPTDSWE